MEKRIKIFLNDANPAQATMNAAGLDALKKELEEKGLGHIDPVSCEIVFDDKDGAEVNALMEKHLLSK